MQIYITRDGGQYGPYTQEEVISYVNAGNFTPSDLAWHEGYSEWLPISQLVLLTPLPIPPPVGTLTSQPPHSSEVKHPKNDKFSDFEILQIASRQKIMIWLILASFIAVFIPYALLVTGIISLVLIYQQAKTLRLPFAWIYAVLSLIPIICSLILILVNTRATAAMKCRNIHVGLMGAKKSDLDKLKSRI